MRLVFFGTADFAVPSLQALHQAGHEVLAVITAPDKPSGRGLKLSASPVKQAAQALGLPILQPEKLRDEDFQNQLRALQPELGVVVAFRMMPESLWQLPRLGTINLHGSLLPDYRGAAPIHWAVANGEEKTGVTTFFLRHEIDTGDLILQEEEPIYPDDTTGQVYERLMHKGATLLARTVDAIAKGAAPRRPQDLSLKAHHAPKITKENSEVRPAAMTVKHAVDLVRGMNPFPSAWATLQGKFVKLHKLGFADAVELPAAEPGSLASPDKKRLYLRFQDGWAEVITLQPEGKKAMTGLEAINGRLFSL